MPAVVSNTGSVLAATLSGLALLIASAVAAAAEAPRVAPAKPKTSMLHAPQAVPGCPDQGGLLDSITVPVDQPLDLSVVIGAPAPKGGVRFNIFSSNATIVAAGDKRQGFIPTVTIPEGQTQSNTFTIFGISVGQTRLQLVPLSPGYGQGSFPLGAWDINKSNTGPDQKFLDANDPANSCRVAGSGQLSTAAATRATCGKAVKGVAADGVNSLLLRTASGLAGTACFEIVSTSSADQGKVQTPVTGSSPVSGLNYGFSYYTPPAFFGDAAETRNVEFEFSFTPNIGNGNTSRLRATLQVLRPPLVLVHGLWSDGAGWSEDFLKNTATRTSLAADYRATNASSFTANSTRVKDAVERAVTLSRKKGLAATQADVAGHSMGGLLTRLYSDAQDYKRAENLDRGDVHRLVTLDTPHLGSSFANLLVSLHNVDAKTATKVESTVRTLTGGSLTQGAVCDLAENSAGLAALNGGTSLRSQVITATGGPAGTASAPAPYWGGATVFGAKSFENALTETYCTEWTVLPGPEPVPVCVREEFYFPQTLVDAFRFREANDAVVSLSSQQGGLAGINFAEYIHFHIPAIPFVQRGITDGANVATRAEQLLHGDDSGLASSLPGVGSSGDGVLRTVGTATQAADYAAQCGAGGPMMLAGLRSPVAAKAAQVADARVRIVAPGAGATVALGDALTVDVELMPPLQNTNTVGVSFVGQQHVRATWVSGLRFRATLPSTALAAGPLTLVPDFTDTAGNVFSGEAVTVNVKPATPPLSIALQQRNFFERPQAGSRQLVLSGKLADGSVIDLTSAATGTTYASSDAAVLTVTPDGLVSIVGAGRASVTVANGTLQDLASFVVEDPSSPLPSASVSNSIAFTKSGFRLDRSTGFYVQTLTVRNIGGAPLPAPLVLVIKGLTPGVTLVSKSGLTGTIVPVGSPYLLVPLPGEGLSLPAGASVDFTLRFLNIDRRNITYTPDVVVTSGNP